MSYKSEPTRLVRKIDNYLASLIAKIPYDPAIVKMAREHAEENRKITSDKVRLMNIRTGAMSKLETC